jgi:antitoxin HigA-1
MIRIPTNRTPTHPGEVLLTEFLRPLHISEQVLADSIHVSFQAVHEIIEGRRGISRSTALRLSKYFGTSIAFWTNLQ